MSSLTHRSRRLAILASAGAWAALAGTQWTPDESRAQSPSKPVQASTSTARSPTVADLYKAERLRDPFMEGGGAAVAVGEPEPFSIHALRLKGILQDLSGEYAVLVQPSAGASYLLRKGKLYDSKNKPMPGVTGIVKPKQKTVHLMTPDKDVQTLILGEEQEGT